MFNYDSSHFREFPAPAGTMTIKPPTLPLFIGTFLAVLAAPVADGRQTPPDVEWFIQHEGSREEAHGHHILQCEDGGWRQ